MGNLFEAYPEKGIVLIPIQDTDSGQLVDARQLHAFLGVGRDFSSWLKGRIDRYDFIDGTDYIASSPDLGSQSTNYLGGQKQGKVDYGLTLDMAKQLCMVENNAKGAQARNYFIECERIAKETQPIPGDYLTALKALVASEEKKNELLIENKGQQEILATQAPKVEAFDRMMDSHGFTLISKAAKILGIGPIKLFEYLRKKKVLLTKGSMHNSPSQKAIRLGWAVIKMRPYTKKDGSIGTSSTTYLTVKGIEGSRKLLEKEGFYMEPMPDEEGLLCPI